MAPSSAAATTSVQVALRIRPTTTQDATSMPARFQRTVIHAISSDTVSVDATPSAQAGGSLVPGSPLPAASANSPAKKQMFTFDQVLGPDSTQHSVFVSTAEPLISRFLEGFNCTILAYGQTSSGKTFSMTGVDLDANPSDPSNGMGIIPRSIATIFARANALKEERGGGWTYSIKGSFIELYNEDLRDLLNLDDGTGGRREVQIREDKHGHIIWDGLREVSVKSTGEVMTLIRQGTSIRRTNETDMNAQSSRSHAIFSLTLTQRKYTGTGAPPRSSTPVQVGGRSPSRLARPSSTYGVGSTRVASPTFGRPPTPSFASAMGRSGGLRPSSAMGMQSAAEPKKSLEEDSGEWVTIVSKFHFVDLAGSERLKRTAAVGERVKEGISINSGLLALGNVISALGDPSRAKTNTASHVPYRDSKLTRLLQDSLGGNAHTLMIACVSPAEWNAGETVNTLKYANRARNIKNRAVVTEKEEGWDDLEWLQNMVTRLRKEVKLIKEGGGTPIVRVGNDHVEVEGASKKMLSQMSDLQNNYEDLRSKFVERTEELTRLRRELGEAHRGTSTGSVSGTAKYEEIVGPVIEEYEKTISAMEAELSLNRAALRHTNDLVEEKEEELSSLSERHSATELYVEELKSRVSKLSEREGSTEAYIRDLEEKIKLHEDTSMSSSESVSDLKREIARYKEGEERNAHYISELEARLARSDESVLSLREAVERLEREAETRHEEAETLQTRLDNVLNDGESWRTDLEERENRVRDLEAKMEDWEVKLKEADEKRSRLGEINSKVQRARQSLEVDMADAKAAQSSRPPSPTPVPSVESSDVSAEKQLESLRETHAATLTDLTTITAKYRDALKEISDLAEQINEIKLGSPSDRSDSPDRLPDVPLTPGRRRGNRSRQNSDVQVNMAGRKPFFRHAASVESLQSRSLSQSQSLSQELSSARSRMLSSPEPNGINGFGHGHSPSTSRSNLSISLPFGPNERSVASLENEIMRLQEVLKERESEISTLETSLKQKDASHAAPTKLQLPNGHTPQRSELSPLIMDQIAAIRRSMEIRHPPSDLPSADDDDDDDQPLNRLNELMLSMAQKEARHREVVEDLNEQLEYVRRERDDLTTLSRDQALNMSSELEALRGDHSGVLVELEALRRREADLLQERTTLEEKFEADIESLKRAHEDVIREKQLEIDTLLERQNSETDSKLADLHKQLAEVSGALSVSEREHGEAFSKLKADHEEELLKVTESHEKALGLAKDDHEVALSKVKSDHEAVLAANDKEHLSVLQRTEEEYYSALSKLRTDHAELLAKKEADFQSTLERLREEHAGELKMADLAREGSMTESQSQQANLMRELQAEHASAVEKKEALFVEDLRKAQEEHAAAIAKKQEDHSAAIERLKSKHSLKLTELEESKDREIEALRASFQVAVEEHSSAISSLRDENMANLEKLEKEHADVIEDMKRDHEQEVQRIKAEHAASLEEANSLATQSFEPILKEKVEEAVKLKAEHQQILLQLEEATIAAQEQHRQDLEEARARTDQLLAEEHDRLAGSLADLETSHSQEVETLRKDHELLVEELASYRVASEEHVLARESTRQIHVKELQEKDRIILDLKHDHDAAESERSELHETLEELRRELEQSRLKQSQLSNELGNKKTLDDEINRNRAHLSEVQSELQKTREQRDTLLAERAKQESIVRELQVQVARTIGHPDSHPSRPSDRNPSFSRTNGMGKLPPLTPPPSVPPPPAPRSIPPVPVDVAHSISSQSTNLRSSGSSRESNPDSPSTSLAASAVPPSPTDPRLNAQVEEQARHIEEQEAMIKTLNKQLTHCEGDLQAHMDLVSTLETSLGDSEKNLRKARMQATEIARERDTLSSQIEKLRHDLEEARREVSTVRRSVVEEKQSLENRLDEERRAKERVRQQLDLRVDELQKRKSKFVCL